MEGTEIIPRTFNDVEIGQRQEDGYLNATAMCKAGGKLWGNYWQTDRTQSYLNALSRSIGIPIDHLIAQKLDGPNDLRGTWVHRKVAIHLAQWISDEFALQVTDWIEELLTTGKVEIAGLAVATPVPRIGAWSERWSVTFKNHGRLVNEIGRDNPDQGRGCFTVVTAMLGGMLSVEDELLRHCLPVQCTDRPDVSVGLIWAAFRRSQGMPASRLTAKLLLPLGNGKFHEVSPLVYPACELAVFNDWFQRIYLPEKLPNYLIDKYKKDYGVLSPASAANLACLDFIGEPAKLSTKLQRQLETAPKEGGRVMAVPLLADGKQGQRLLGFNQDGG